MKDSTLLVIQGPEQGRRYELFAGIAHVGRGAQNEIRILDTEISRKHARIALENGEWIITDLDSSNGTYLNGRSVQRAVLRHRDQLQIGRTILLFTREDHRQERSAVDRISLLSQQADGDHSQIVSQARHADHSRIASGSQMGANLELLYQITELVVSPSTTIDEILQQVLDLTLKAVGADRGCMLVTDSKTDRIEPRVLSFRDSQHDDEQMPISRSIVEYVIQNGQGVRTSDARYDSRFDQGQSIVRSGIREALCVPMRGRYELMGVIYVDTTRTQFELSGRTERSQFSDQQLMLLLAIGRQTALAIENHRYQDALMTSERLAGVGQTVAIMGHHIKNILQGIRGGGYLIDTGLKQDNGDLIRKGWDVVERNQDRIYNLVMDLLTFSKEREPNPQMNSVAAVIQDVTELLQMRLEENQITSQIVPDGESPESWFDSEGIHRALLNIMTNAIDALTEVDHPHLTIRYGHETHEDLMWIEVEDNGPGIPDEELERLFNLFESSKGFKGTGLGLAVSRKILQEHGGTILVNTRLGTGTCFRLQWPYQSEENE